MIENLEATDLPWLFARAQRNPDREAIRFGDLVLTFAELAERVELVAGRLAALGVRPGDRVALLMNSSLRFVEIVHAAEHSGAALVPINVRLSKREVAALVADAEPRILLHDEKRRTVAEAVRPRASELRIADSAEELDAVSLAAFQRAIEIAPENVSTILYTSGTTGRPKGAMLTHGNHFESARASRANLGVFPEDRWLAVLPLHHVGGLSVFFRSVLDGVPVTLHRGFDPERVNRAIRENGITLLSLVPTMLSRLLDQNGEVRYPSTLRCVLVGGASVPPALVDRALALGMPVAPTYGLTEAASQVATALPSQAARKPGSSGRPLPGTRVEIPHKDASGRGEILVQGPTVMAGYFRSSKATAEALRGGWLHTGDIGHFDEEGFLYIDDRRSDLIVSGGENVYPAEVEAVLLAHSAVAEAAVYPIADREWGQRVAARVVLREGSAMDEGELRAWCRERLAGFKVPDRIDFVASLPRTASGKIRRRLLKRSGEKRSRPRG